MLLDQQVDQQADAAIDPRCVGRGSSYFCDYTLDLPYGRVGRCEQGQFELDRFCFAGAPCDAQEWNRCKPGGCNSCAVASCTGVCSLFLAPLNQLLACCVTPNPDNGQGTALDSCDHNYECVSGLCTTAGRCYQACGQHTGTTSCPEDLVCRPVSVLVAGRQVTTFGCAAGGALDASVDPPASDAGSDLSPSPDLVEAAASDAL